MEGKEVMCFIWARLGRRKRLPMKGSVVVAEK